MKHKLMKKEPEKKFPRFKTIKQAVEAAEKRSKAGGATKTSLMNRN